MSARRLLAAIARTAVPLILYAAPTPAAGQGGPDVLRYDVELQVVPADSSVAGELLVEVQAPREGMSALVLDAPGLAVQGVWSGQRRLRHELREGRLTVRLDRPLRPGGRSVLRIRYSGRPTRGMHFGPDQVYTAFHTAHWLPSRSDPADKAALTLRLVLPAGLEVAASGRSLGRDTLPDGRVRHLWREDRPYSTYLFGFAAARFAEAAARADSVRLRFLGVGLDPAELERVFASAAPALRFLAERAGVPYPGDTHTQALLPGAPAQEMAGMAIMSERYGRSVLDDPREDYLVVHELAHSWWGNLVTAADWSHFWLNEGIVTYLVAAYKEFFWGPAEYEREMVMARLRYQRALAEGAARPLVFAGWSAPEEMGGPMTYSKGALVLHLLRAEVGDSAFWAGLRVYTRRGAMGGGVVRTADLRAAMEEAGGRDLGWFFEQWAHAPDPPPLVARHRYEPGAVVVEVEQPQPVPWRIGLRLAAESAEERVSRRVTLTGPRHTFRIPLSGAPVSVRVDEGGYLPRGVAHARPVGMLLRQAAREPDAAGRVDALLALGDACAEATGAECSGVREAVQRVAAGDPARIVRQVAARTLERLAPRDSRP
ncbi:MAG TPA: M1 family metallopeptidase [Longimicrobiaceae bacterium]|nr:M1 family metallopeptidase [Longimicrobiaceae bacterium]